MTRLAGYAWTWGAPATKFGCHLFAERGDFAAAVQQVGTPGAPALPAFWDHGHATLSGTGGKAPIARVDVLKEDAIGLYYEAETIPTSDTADAVTAIGTGVVHGTSIGFDHGLRDLHAEDANYLGPPEFRITDVRLLEISPCNFPAHPGTSVWIAADKQPPDGGEGTQP